MRFLALQHLADDQAWIAHSYRVQKELGDVIVLFRSAEYFERTYLVNHRASTEKKFDAAVRALPLELKDVGRLVSGDPVHERSIGEIERRLTARVRELQEEAVTGNPLVTDASLQVRDEDVVGRIDAMLSDEDGRLVEREKHLYNGVASSLIYLEALAGLALGSGLVLIGMLFRDLRRRIRAERAMQKAKEEADAANRAKSLFLANISHEIRTPLNAIVGFSDLLLEPAIAVDDKRQFVRIIGNNCRLLSQIIDDTLDLAKVEAGKLNTELLPCVLSDLLQDVTAVLGKQARDKGVALTVVTGAGVPDRLVTDPTRLRQILFNIVGNAVKFTTTGSVALSVAAEPEAAGAVRLRFAVADTGQGISAAEQSRLFRPFSQADASTTRRFGGTGLGLLLSRQLARLLGGDVVLVQSAPGAGSRFEITITTTDPPAPPASGPAAPAPHAATAALPLAGVRVLVADDTTDSRVLVMQILKHSGAVADAAENGAQAVTMALDGTYDLILMDLQMPVLDGFLATAELRRKGYSRPIVAVSAAAMREERERSLAVGCDLHIAKPISRVDLISTLAGLRIEPDAAAARY